MAEDTSARKSILFFTNCEHGQANVILAVAYEFLLRDEFDVHIASYPALAPRVDYLNDLFASQNRKENGCEKARPGGQHGEEAKAANGPSLIPTATFHPIQAKSMMDIAGDRKASLPHPPGLTAAVKSYQTLIDVFFAFEPPEYMACVNLCADIIKNVNPTAIVSDPMIFGPIDAATLLNRECAVLCPSSFKDLLGHIQPKMAALWKYPQLFVLGKKTAQLNQCRKENGISTPLPSTEPYRPGRLHICPALPEIDLPLDHIPDDVIGCGPIVLPAPPVSESDPELASWLDEGPPVVLINLGSHIEPDPRAAAEMAKSLRIVLDRFPDTRFLWKLKYKWTKSDELYQILSTEIESGRVRIPNWLITDPVSILETGKIICSVHHGGANSFYEACRAGIPQVLLPVWWDTYEFTARAEWLGIGAHGSRGSAPEVEASELSKTIIRVLGDEGMMVRAKEIRTICRKGEGRVIACEKLIAWAKGPFNTRYPAVLAQQTTNSMMSDIRVNESNQLRAMIGSLEDLLPVIYADAVRNAQNQQQRDISAYINGLETLKQTVKDLQKELRNERNALEEKDKGLSKMEAHLRRRENELETARMREETLTHEVNELKAIREEELGNPRESAHLRQTAKDLEILLRQARSKTEDLEKRINIKEAEMNESSICLAETLEANDELRNGLETAEERARDAEEWARDAEEWAHEAEGQAHEAEGRAREAEGRAREAEGRAHTERTRRREAEKALHRHSNKVTGRVYENPSGKTRERSRFFGRR
ncbi:hypothetical protein FQN54_009230 [Arachnomyces sp. PD_36]|nr:hypothetical protein FQN54_009230 [Arachnomyces sp. PD_36]